MTLRKAVQQKIAEWQPAAGQRQSLVIADEGSGWTITLTVDRKDDVGCLIWELTLRRGKGTEAALDSWAKEVAARVTGLLEPLKVVEVDSRRNEALLRSAEPTGSAEGLHYYEVLLKGSSEMLLRRYQGFAEDTRRRRQLLFALTHEVLAKACADLAGCE
jgi:hypothetical protein